MCCPALGRRKQVAGLSEATFGGVLDAGADEPLVGLQGPVRAYAKPEREDLTPADTKALTRLVAAIKKERQGSDDGTHRPSDVRLKRLWARFSPMFAARRVCTLIGSRGPRLTPRSLLCEHAVEVVAQPATGR